MRIKNYTDWENIFLDTSIIISLLRSLRDDTDEVCNFIGQLINDLAKKQTNNKKDRTFYISSISLSEILERSNNQSKIEKIIKAIDSENVIFYPFDNDVSDFIVEHYHSHLAKPKQTEFARLLSWPDHDLHIAREWINKDLMLIATAHYLDCDSILTIDVKTMYSISENVDYFCALCYPENFQLSHNRKNIFNYDRPKKNKK